MGTASGQLCSYLASLPAVYGTHGPLVAELSSLAEVTVADVASRQVARVEVAVEPLMCGVGPHHLAVGINNQVGIA